MKKVKIILKIFVVIMFIIMVINCINIKDTYAAESTINANSIMDKGKNFIEKRIK